MKKNSYIVIILSLFLIIGVGLYINKKNKLEEESIKEQANIEENLQKEISGKLDELEVNPIIENENIISESESIEEISESETGTEKEVEVQKKSAFDLIKEERTTILTFSNVKQCADLMYLKKECENTFLYSLAVSSNNITYCNKLATTTEINNCKDDINYNNNNCRSIINKYLRSKCDYNNKEALEEKTKEVLFTTKNDISRCNGLETYTDKEECVKNVILNTKKIDLCLSFFTKDEEKNTCYKNVSYEYNRAIISEAYEKKDTSLCELLTTQELKNQCKTMKF